MKTRLQKQHGFTLAEMAIVVLIMGIALSMGLKMLTANLDNAAYSETKSKQERIKIALIGFLRTNGRLPCPDSALVTPNTGLESACVAAGTGYGIVPWAVLGLSREAVLDGWGNYFTYVVANTNPATAQAANPLPRHVNANQNWTIKVGAGSFDIRSFTPTTAVQAGFRTLWIQNRDPAPGPNTEAFNAVVVILSHGKNGLGAKTTKVALRIAGAAADELTNATVGSTTFFRRPVTEAAPVGGAYDDVLAYMTAQDLLQPLISEKTVYGTCASYCAVGTCPAAPANICNATNIAVGAAVPLCQCTQNLSTPQ